MNTFTRRNNITIAVLAVVSSQIAAVGYDEPSKTLAVNFNAKDGEAAGPHYHYFDVPAETGKELLAIAERNQKGDEVSVGKFFYASVKPFYQYQRISPDVGAVKNADGTPVEEQGQGGATQGQQQTEQHAA